jgi:hypothetical protein
MGEPLSVAHYIKKQEIKSEATCPPQARPGRWLGVGRPASGQG